MGYKRSMILRYNKAINHLFNEAIMPQSANDIDEIEEELKSKSEIKREMISLQAFAQKLIEMSKHNAVNCPFQMN